MNALISFAVLTDYSLVQLVIAAIIIIGICGIVMVVLRYSEIKMPPWLMPILGIVALIVVAVIAVKIIASL